MYGRRFCRTNDIARSMACQEAIGSLPSTTSPGMPKALPRSMMWRSPWTSLADVEMPQLLFWMTISTGNSWPGRVDQTRQEAKSPSAVPASPPVTMVIPRPPARLCAIPVPMQIEYCGSITELTGTTFQARFE